MTPADRPQASPADRPRPDDRPEHCRPSCPACGGSLVEVKAKLVCSRCRTIIETCCEGGPG